MVGDDAAIRKGTAGEQVIITTDLAIEEVHFSLRSMTLEEIGYRAMITNLSDCAAMGAVPDGALVDMVFPQKGADISRDVGEIYRGFSCACNEWNFPIVGGDLSGGPVWIIGITLLGRALRDERLLLRTGIRDGDTLWCTGIPGQSAAGLDALRRWGRSGVPGPYQALVERHIHPRPRIKTGRALASSSKVHAMMDLSDGLSKDCATLCFENRLGLVLNFDSSQPPSSMVQLSRELGIPYLDWMLHGGEEYELLFTSSPAYNPARIDADEGVCFVKLGTFTKKKSGFFLREGDGSLTEVEHRSWDHVREARDRK